MYVPLDRKRLASELTLWEERVRIGHDRLRIAKRYNWGKSACISAIKGIKAAEKEVANLKDLLQICERQNRRRDGENAEPKQEMKLTLSPPPSPPKPDRKREKRKRDQQTRARMKGRQLSDDSKHGRKRVKK